ncbi:DNA mismatch endonuclease Vsr [Rugamonas sp. FT107W]|uniref:Very short patch repair endonuclease n=1 Tax=Duganella vulcania TaxID=2692166 RepID=A0A845HED4_9BURK|nr:DNA mismatch endonuclease Vsr [Duganella vulcania]MYN17121.1 DNA mismatch endonuclease Vsr [Duganella vulcania]
MDVHTPERRSRNMRAVRSKNTNPEIIIRKLLFSQGFRFRIHVKSLPGNPDIVLPKYRVAVFVHGCFWHGHGCYLFKLPNVRREFWQNKIAENKLRDVRDFQILVQSGWRVLYVWECACKGRLKWNYEELAQRLSDWIHRADPRAISAEIQHV